MKRAVSVLLGVSLLLTSFFTGNIMNYCAAASSEDYYIPAIDFSNLTPGSYRDTEELGWAGIIPEGAEILTEGIWVDPVESMGFGEPLSTGKTNIHGFIANDKNGDGITESISAIPNDNAGIQYTLGINCNNDFTGAKALAVHLNNTIHSTLWTYEAILRLNPTLIDDQGNEYPLMTDISTISPDEKGYYVQMDTEEIVEGNRAFPGYRAIKEGWCVYPLAIFEEGFDLSKIKKIRFYSDSWWESPLTFESVGFVTDSLEFVRGVSHYYENHEINCPNFEYGTATIKVGEVEKKKARKGQQVTVDIEPYSDYATNTFSVTTNSGETIPVKGTTFIMPDEDVTINVTVKRAPIEPPSVSGFYTNVLDFTGVQEGDYRNDSCTPDTSSSLYSSGLVVDSETLGIGTDKSNFYGFWAEDLDNDGVVDRLRTDPYDANGMRFTLGIKTEDITVNTEAVVVHIDNQKSNNKDWTSKKLKQMNISLVNGSGEKTELKTGNEASGINICFISDASAKISTYDLKDGMSVVPGKGSGWVVIPVEAFESFTTASNYKAISFDLASGLGVNTVITEIGFTSDIEEIVKIFNRNPTKHSITVVNGENGISFADVTEAAVGSTIGMTYDPDDDFTFDAAIVKGDVTGTEIPLNNVSFIMPNEPVTVTVSFKVSPYTQAKRISDLVTTVVSFEDMNEKSYFVGEGGDFSELINNGVLVKNEGNGFRADGDNNAYNLKGLYLEKSEAGQMGLRLWPQDYLGMSVTLKTKQIEDAVPYEGMAIYIDNTGCAAYSDKCGPFFNPIVYLKDKNGNPDLNNPIGRKKSNDLWGVEILLIDKNEGTITQKALGYSPDQETVLDDNQKHYSSFFLPDGFCGWCIIPFSYFGAEFKAQDVAAVTMLYEYLWWDYMSTIYEVGFTPSIRDCLRIAELSDVTFEYEYGETEVIDSSVFEEYAGYEGTMSIVVNKDYLPFYVWNLNFEDFKNKVSLNPDITRMTPEEAGVNKFYNAFGDTIMYHFAADSFPGKATIMFDVSWDFADATKLYLYRYNPNTGEFIQTDINAYVKGGNISFEFTEGGWYALGTVLPYNEIPYSTENNTVNVPSTIVVDTTTITQKSGHYETIPGIEKYKTVTTIRAEGFATWFIITLICGGIVLLCGGVTATVLIIKKKKKGRKIG